MLNLKQLLFIVKLSVLLYNNKRDKNIMNSLTKTTKISWAEIEWSTVMCQIQSECMKTRNQVVQSFSQIGLNPLAARAVKGLPEPNTNLMEERGELVNDTIDKYTRIRVRIELWRLFSDKNEYFEGIFEEVKKEAYGMIGKMREWIIGMNFPEKNVQEAIDPIQIFDEEWERIVEDIQKTRPRKKGET